MIRIIFLFIIAFIQNMAFTLVSRSRNSGDPKRHLYAAIGSNSIWFVCNYFILFPEIMKSVSDGDIWDRVIFLVVYVSATSLGSVFMMKLNLGTIRVPFLSKLFMEKGRGKVGER